jgi:hypothetical protein
MARISPATVAKSQRKPAGIRSTAFPRNGETLVLRDSRLVTFR